MILLLNTDGKGGPAIAFLSQNCLFGTYLQFYAYTQTNTQDSVRISCISVLSANKSLILGRGSMASHSPFDVQSNC